MVIRSTQSDHGWRTQVSCLVMSALAITTLRALRHTAVAGDSVMATVITNTLWHCFSHHQWADVGAVVYGCMAT